jgi:hypothetical protein
VIDGNRYLRRLILLARWAFPDLWSAFSGSLPTAVAVWRPDHRGGFGEVCHDVGFGRDRVGSCARPVGG